MYNVGDEVVYPMHGAGRIVAIEEREVMEEKQSYYILEMPGEVKVMIPTATAEEHGIRSVINKEEAQKVMSVLEQDETEMEKNLSFKQKEKGLSTGEKKMLYNAKQILVSELVFAENSTQNEVEELIDSKINSSYAMFRTDDGEIGKASAGSIVNKFIPFNG